jgi:hypothetical protein
MSSIRITYTSHPATTAEQARDARARAWRFVFDCYAKNKAVTSEEKPASPPATGDANKGI